MAKLQKKHPFIHALTLIVIYLLVLNTTEYLINYISDGQIISSFILLILGITILIYLLKNKWSNYCGLSLPTKKEIFDSYLYIPLLLVLIIYCFSGFNFKDLDFRFIYYIIMIISICFLEETIFRGFLFKSLESKSLIFAIILSSITFSIDNVLDLLFKNTSLSSEEFIIIILEIWETILIGFSLSLIFSLNYSVIDGIIYHFLLNVIKYITNSRTLKEELVIISICTIILIIYNLLLFNKLRKRKSVSIS